MLAGYFIIQYIYWDTENQVLDPARSCFQEAISDRLVVGSREKNILEANPSVKMLKLKNYRESCNKTYIDLKIMTSQRYRHVDFLKWPYIRRVIAPRRYTTKIRVSAFTDKFECLLERQFKPERNHEMEIFMKKTNLQRFHISSIFYFFKNGIHPKISELVQIILKCFQPQLLSVSYIRKTSCWNYFSFQDLVLELWTSADIHIIMWKLLFSLYVQ